MSGLAHCTDCGLPGIREIPYGIHMCHFYASREELAGALVPYFAAGLRNNERCIWITADPLDEADARDELEKAGVDWQAAQRNGSLTIRSHAQWYAGGEGLKADEIVERWFAEERRALEQGFSALRVTGNVSFATPQAWAAFMEYEKTLDTALEGHRIVALCSYPAAHGAAEILDVAHSHQCTLDHPDRGWQVLTRGPSAWRPSSA
jgi:hypothetical protein